MSENGKRRNTFEFEHIAFRWMLNKALQSVSTCFYLNEDEMKACATELSDAISIYRRHSEGEDEYRGKALAEKEPELAKTWMDDHDIDDMLQSCLDQMNIILEKTDAPEDRGPLMDKLYYTLSSFIEKNLKHMEYEETVIQEALWKHFTDEELKAMHSKHIKASPVDAMKMVGPRFVEGLGFRRRIVYLKLKLKSPSFPELLDICKNVSSEAEFAYIEKELGLS